MTQKTASFSIAYYFQTLAKVLGTPVDFYGNLPETIGFKQSVGFLMISSAFFAGASLLTRQYHSPVLAGGIFFANAVGMTVIAAGLGYILMSMFAGRRVSFRVFFSVYAFASGVVLLAAWIPLFVWLTEPWKWVLIGIGLTHACGLKWITGVLIIVTSIVMMMLFFWSLVPVIS
jgi:hypothetical protein